jgi:protein-disulfide isomerase-like protein with CxxC motif
MSVAVLHMTDPGCPWAYSASPALAVLRWRFGDQLEWRLSMIGLTEDRKQYEDRGYTAKRYAAGRLAFKRFGMPLSPRPRPRLMATARGCRTVVAARLRHPGREDAVLRALQFAWFTTDELMDTDEGLLAALEDVGGIDAGALVGALDDADVTEAYEADRALARTAEGSPCEAMGRTAQTDGPVRYTAPSLVFEHGSRRLDAGGFQQLDAYDVCLANLDSRLERREHAEHVVDAVAAFPDGLTSQEVTAIMTPRLGAEDRPAAERALVEAAADGLLRSRPLGDDALWMTA